MYLPADWTNFRLTLLTLHSRLAVDPNLDLEVHPEIKHVFAH